MQKQLDHWLSGAISAAKAAGLVIQEAFGEPMEHFEKRPGELVTETDRRAEQLIREILLENDPDIDFWGEESGRDDRGASLCWLVDPLDGTKNFIHGYPFVAVSIALIRDRKPLVGVVLDPLRADLFTATLGGGACRNGRRLSVSRTKTFEDALVVTNPKYLIPAHRPKTAEESMAIFQRCLGMRRGGAFALDLAYVAAGAIDAMWEIGCQPWDVAAGCLLIEEAQGTTTDLDGRPYHIGDEDLLVSNTHLHQSLVEILKS